MDITPIFPLPNAVLFPQTVLPLHIFEERYRAMVRDAVDGDGRIAIALLKPGYDRDYHGSPEIHPVGTVGKLENVRPLEDGRFVLDVVGLQRVRFEELRSERPYRMAHLVPLPEEVVDESNPEIEKDKLEILAAQGFLIRELSRENAPGLPLNDRIGYEAAVNGACANLPSDPIVRQQLLEEDDITLRHSTALSLINAVIQKILEFRQDDEPSPDQLN